MRYLFVGNRPYVFDEMLRLGLNVVGALVMKDSFLHRTFDKGERRYSFHEVIDSKKQLLHSLDILDYDILISNGCRYLLPVKHLKEAKYINIHPSYLPDLRGRDPINGALLYNRDIGATCHHMDDGIDTGDIISQVFIPNTNDLDAALLFQLCFQAEVKAFRKAFQRNFASAMPQPKRPDTIYYTQKLEDRLIDFDEDVSTILRRVRAYGYQSKGCFFGCGGNVYRVYHADLLHNEFILEYSSEFQDLEVIFVYEDSIVFKKDEKIVRFSRIAGDLTKVHICDHLENCSSAVASEKGS